MTQTRARPGSEGERGQTHEMLGESIKPHGNPMNMGVGQGEMSEGCFRGLRSGWKKAVGSVDLKPGPRGHVEKAGRLGAGLLRTKAVRERRWCLKGRFRLYYFRGGAIWGLAMGVVELERRRLAKVEEVKVIPVDVEAIGMTAGGGTGEQHRRWGLESYPRGLWRGDLEVHRWGTEDEERTDYQLMFLPMEKGS